jgi:Leucine-rich repeat (LRR) protein
MKLILCIFGLFAFSNERVHEESFQDLVQALQHPEIVTVLSLQEYAPECKHLPSQIGTLINLKELYISCLENIEDLPQEIGNLTKLEKLVIDNGNGCQMNVSIPESIGNLKKLKVLRLYGALDAREFSSRSNTSRSQIKRLPESMKYLTNLEELDLGRNGMKTVPPQIAFLHNLKKLVLDANEIHEIPAFVGNLKNLQELSVCANPKVKLPESLSVIKGLKICIGNNYLTLKDQEQLRSAFPHTTFLFENEYDDDAANEEPRN